MRKFIPGRGYFVEACLHINKPLTELAKNSDGYRVFASESTSDNPFRVDDSWKDKVLGTEEPSISEDDYKRNANYNIPYNPDFIYIDAWLASSLESKGPNTNGDAFEAEELAERHYTWQFRGKYIDHANDSITKSVGIILATNYDASSERVRIIFALPRKEFPDLVEKIDNGEITDISLGLIARSAECSICHNIATGMGTECSHIPYKGVKSGYYEINRGITGIESSIITDAGADVNAKMLKVFSKASKEKKMKITAAWFGNTLLPVLQQFKAEGKDITTREKILGLLKEASGVKEQERYISALSDKDYKEMIDRFVSGSFSVSAGDNSTMKITDFLGQLKTLHEAGFQYVPDSGKKEAVDEIESEEEEMLDETETPPEEDSAAPPEEVENTEDQIDLEVIEDNTNNSDIEEEVEEDTADLEEDTVETGEVEEDVTLEDIESENPDESIAEDPDVIGGLDDEEASAASKQIDSVAKELQDEEFKPTDEIVESLEDDTGTEDAYGAGEKLTSFLRSESFALDKGDILKSVNDRWYTLAEKPSSESQVKAKSENGKNVTISCPKIFRIAGRKGIRLGSSVTVRLPKTIHASHIGFAHGKSGKVVGVGVLAYVDMGKNILQLPYDIITGKKYTQKPGDIARTAILANRPVWAEDYVTYKKAISAAKASGDLDKDNLIATYRGMAKKDDPIVERKSTKCNEKYYTLSKSFPKGMKVRFFTDEGLKHSVVAGSVNTSLILSSGRKISPSAIISEANYMTFSNLFRKNKASRTVLEKHWGERVAKVERVASDTNSSNRVLLDKVNKDKSILLSTCRNKDKVIISQKNQILALKKEIEFINPILDLAESKSYGIFADSQGANARSAYKVELEKKSADQLRHVYQSIKNYRVKSDLVRLTTIKNIPSGGRSTKVDEFDSLIKDISTIK